MRQRSAGGSAGAEPPADNRGDTAAPDDPQQLTTGLSAPADHEGSATKLALPPASQGEQLVQEQLDSNEPAPTMVNTPVDATANGQLHEAAGSGLAIDFPPRISRLQAAATLVV